MLLAEEAQGSALGQVSADQAVGIFIRRTLPRAVRIADEDVHAKAAWTPDFTGPRVCKDDESRKVERSKNCNKARVCSRVEHVLRGWRGMMRRMAPQDNSSELAAHPNRLALRGSPGDAVFPPLCPNCGGSAIRNIEYAKVFRHIDSDGPTRYTVSWVAVPFCGPCIARHRAQAAKPSLSLDLISSFATLDMLGAVFPAMAALFLAWLALGDVLHGRGTRFLMELGIGAVFALIAWAQGWAVWHETERFRVPPQSDVTLAFDFGDDTASAFEPARFVCTIRDLRFADAFRALNIDREWHAGSPEAVAERRRATRKMWLFGAIVAIFALWNLLRDFFN